MMSYMTDTTVTILISVLVLLFSKRILNLSLTVLSMVTTLAVAVFSIAIAGILLVITAIPLGAGTCIIAKNATGDGTYPTQFLHNLCASKPKSAESRKY